MFGDDLNVRVTSSTTDFTAGMQTAQSSLGGLRNDALQTAAAMQVLQGRMDEAGDEATTAGAKAGASSSGFSALAASAATAEISFSSLSVVTAATLIPSLLALSTVLAPLTAALGGFITVAGSIAGIGLVGFIGAAVTNSERLKSTFDQLTATIRNEFAPVFDIFAGVLDRLMQRLTAIIPELVPAEDVIRRIAGQFEQLGMAVIEVLPAFMKLAVELTDRFLPAFTRWASGVLPKVPGFLRGLIPTMLQVGQTLAPLADAFMRISSTMTEFGMRVLTLITPKITAFINAWDGAMQAINGMDKETANLVTTLTILSPIIAKIGLVLAGLSAPVLAAAAAVGVLAVAFKTDFGGVRSTINAVGRDLQRVLGQNLPTLIQNIKTIINTLLPVVEPIFNALVKLISFQFVTAIDLAVTAVTALSEILTGDFSGAIQTVMSFLERFRQRHEAIFGGLVEPVRSALNSIINTLNSWKNSLVSAMSSAFNDAKQAALGPIQSLQESISSIIDSITGRIYDLMCRIDDAKEAASNIGGGAADAAGGAVDAAGDMVGLDSGGFLKSDGIYMGHAGERVLNPQETEQLEKLKSGDFGGGGTQTIKLVLEEKTDIVEGRIKEGAELVVEDQGRETRRNRGRNPNLS